MVGWTFGADVAGAYLWKGPAADNLVIEMSVADFYRLTFQNSREEQFIIAYSMADRPLKDQLAAFARGFHREPVLSGDNTPAHLAARAVVNRMRTLISGLVGDGDFYHVLPLMDSRMLTECDDALFLLDVLKLGAQAIGPESAIEIIETVLSMPNSFDAAARRRIREFEKSLYEKWLNLLMHTGDHDDALAVYREAAETFESDPGIRLAGIRLALKVNDWQTAEALLQTGRFPEEFTDRVAGPGNKDHGIEISE